MNSGRSARLGAVAALALVLFNAPVLAVFDVPERVLGMPVLWTYLLVAWAGVIGLVAWTGREP